jgi:hypothetical protein
MTAPMAQDRQTVLDRLIAAIRDAATYNQHLFAPPKVILWTDGEWLWESVAKSMVSVMPELLILQDTSGGDRIGPATRLRYQLDRLGEGVRPVLYLPGISRAMFRGAAGFPANAKHLYALQFQGCFWQQANHKDWTPSAFLSSSEGGLGLDLARDQVTLQALSDQLVNVFDSTVHDLRGRRLEATDFNTISAADPVKLLLQWMSSPDQTKQRMKVADYKAFVALCKAQFRIDPDKDGVITAAEKLATEDGEWGKAWERYCEAPSSYPGIKDALCLVKLKNTSLFDTATTNDRLPQANKSHEDALRASLSALAGMEASAATKQLQDLCTKHRVRAEGVWARLGEAPLATAAVHLGGMVKGIEAGLVGADWETLARSFVDTGSGVDHEALRAVAAVRDAADLQAVTTALQAVYRPWLEKLAERTTEMASTYPCAKPADAPEHRPTAGTVILFVDGLRCDVGHTLAAALKDQGVEVAMEASWAALPTVTATAKPAWRPLATRLVGTELTEDFEPQVQETKKPLKTEEFRKQVTASGWDWFDATTCSTPSAAGWTETGSFDRYGHEQGAKLAWRIEEEVKVVLQRVRELLSAGWKEVRIVTDHGWLWLPGGFPKAELPKHLTMSRWGRCAIAQAGAQTPFKQVSWFWGGEHAVLMAPGISTFKAGLEYAHGGMTLQETLTPRLTVRSTAAAAGDVTIRSTRWAGLRLNVDVEATGGGVTIDVRTSPADPNSSVIAGSPKAVEGNGKISVTVENGDLEGQAAVVVALHSGKVVAKHSVIIGEN